jgi:2-C-methyl-D-erythritol 4-phosphate cytidylyltransferase
MGKPATHNLQLTTLMKNYVIIVAGGSGTRMQSAVPKQFLLLKGKPVLMHTIGAFYDSDAKPDIILVLPSNFNSYWEQLCKEHNFTIPHQLVNGGETRFHSVKNGLDAITDNSRAIIAVHDAVRPLTSKEIIDKSYLHAAEHGNAITAVKSRDSVRQLNNGISTHLLRDDIYLIQTPQTFQSVQIKKAYLQPYSAKFTDDASVIEEAGFPIHLIEGNYQNIKITFAEDIAIAKALMEIDS